MNAGMKLTREFRRLFSLQLDSAPGIGKIKGANRSTAEGDF